MTLLEPIHDTEPQTDSWTPVNLNRLPEAPPTKPDLGQTNLIYPGKRHVFSGPPESAKTLAAYCVLIQVTRTGGSGVLIDFEMGAYDARQRLRELGATADELDRILYIEPDERATPERVSLLIDLEPDLVVIDAAAGAYSLEGLDDNKRLEVERFTNLYVGMFWRNRIATILIDHVVKNAEFRGRFQIGSERKLGAADVHYGFDIIQPISRGSNGRYKILTHKDRAGYMRRGHLADFNVESDPDTHQMEWSFREPANTSSEAGYFRPTHLMEKVSRDLESRNEPVTRNQVYDALGGTKSYLLKAIDVLVREGYVTETAGDNRSKLLTAFKPFREKDDELENGFGSTMPAEPPESSASQATERSNGDLAQPSGGSVVREWFGSGSRTTRASGGSVVRPLTGGEPPEPSAATTENHQNTSGWFDDNGTFIDSELAYLETLTPEPDEDLPF